MKVKFSHFDTRQVYFLEGFHRSCIVQRENSLCNVKEK